MLRQQIIVLRRTAPKRPAFSSIDRLIFVGLHRLFPDVRDALAIVSGCPLEGLHDAILRARRADLEDGTRLLLERETLTADQFPAIQQKAKQPEQVG